MSSPLPVRLPLIVGFGGFSAAGRASGHHAYRRMVIESLPAAERQETLAGLAVMMGLVSADERGNYRDAEGQQYDLPALEAAFAEQIYAGTLIRRIEKTFFDVDAAHWQKNATLGGESTRFELRRRDLPEPLPEGWEVEALADGDRVAVKVKGDLTVKFDSYRELPVKSAGSCPAGLTRVPFTILTFTRARCSWPLLERRMRLSRWVSTGSRW